MRRTITGDQGAERHPPRPERCYGQVANAFGSMKGKFIGRISVATADSLNNYYGIAGEHAISQNIVELLRSRPVSDGCNKTGGSLPGDCVVDWRKANDAGRVRMREAPNQIDDGA